MIYKSQSVFFEFLIETVILTALIRLSNDENSVDLSGVKNKYTVMSSSICPFFVHMNILPFGLPVFDFAYKKRDLRFYPLLSNESEIYLLFRYC